MEDISTVSNGRPRRKPAKASLALDLVEEGLHSDSSLSVGSEDEGKNAARKRRQYSKKSFSKRSEIPKKLSAKAAAKPHTTLRPDTTQIPQSGSAPSVSEPNLSDPALASSSIAPSDSLPSQPSLTISTYHSHSQHTYTDLDDLSDLTPLSSEVDTRPSTPNFVTQGLKANVYTSQAQILASPRKKRKLNTGGQFQAIPVEDRRTEPTDSDYDSDMPRYFEILKSQEASQPKRASKTAYAPPKSKGISKGVQKKKSSMTSDDQHSDEDDDHIVLEIPGEGVLAKASATETQYWPARIDDYIHGTGKQKGKYVVTWLDKTTQAIPRSWFYTSHEPGFVTCTVST